MRRSSWHAFLGIFFGFYFIHLCSSAPSSSRNDLFETSVCDQWTFFPIPLSLSKFSPGFLVSFLFQGSDDIFATYFPPTRWCSGEANSSQVRLGGKGSLKKSAYQGGNDVYLYHNPGFGDGEYSVQLVEWFLCTNNKWGKTLKKRVCNCPLRHISVFLISWRWAVVSRQLPDFNTFMQISQFSPYSLFIKSSSGLSHDALVSFHSGIPISLI